ncbi:MAG: SDR family oxidoreductase [Sciscionella sp.]
MAQPILVTGGTGTLGSDVVRRLLDRGHEVRVLSRRPKPPERKPFTWLTGDLRRGTAIDSAVAGVDTIIHCATGRGDVEAARNLLASSKRAGILHLIYISIVGVDRIPFGYYQSKLAVERLIQDSGLPYTILRATQFHDLVRAIVKVLSAPPVVMLVPEGISIQPIAVAEVARRLVELTDGQPPGRVPDIGGPQVRTCRELAESYLRASGRRRLLVPIRLPGKAYRGFTRGGNLAPEHAVAGGTFEEFLAASGEG